MDYKQTPLGRYIGTFAQEAVAVAYKVTAELITPSMTVSVPLVTQVHTYRDYERNAGDELYISVKFPPGSYGKYILPYQQQLKMRIIVQAYSLMRGQRQTVDDAAQAYVYRAVCLTTVDSRMSANDERTATDSSKKDYEQMVDLQFQLFDPVLESFMQSETGENYTGSKVLDVLRLEFSKILSAVEADTGFKMQGVDIVAPNNDNLFKLLILPHGTNAMDLVDKIQNQVGIYSADVGCYYQSPYLYIYPLYDETRFSDGRRTAIFYNYPADMFPGMDKTWINRDKYVEIACTRGASVSDINNAASLLGNAGAGDIESQPFLEAIRQVSQEVGKENSLFIHVTLVPYLKSSGEHKSKPTQHSVKELQSMGIKPDIIVLRTDEPITDQSIFQKIALFCNVQPDCVIENLTIPVLYEAPIMLEKNHFSDIVCRELCLETSEPDMTEWLEMVEKIRGRKKLVHVALVGKYVKLHDAYLSVMEALRHAGYDHSARVEIDWVDSENLTPENIDERLGNVDGIIIPGGFGSRGIEGMVLACKYAREHDVPYLGICLGMQIAVIEFCRNVCGITDANSGEFDEYGLHKVIDFMPDQNKNINKGGTLRLGSYPCKIKPGTKMMECYGKELISERHRHRYEFNNDYRETVEAAGMVLSGTSPDGRIVETVEIPQNKFFVAGQFHPEFKSRPNRSHPLFKGFIGAAVAYRESRKD